MSRDSVSENRNKKKQQNKQGNQQKINILFIAILVTYESQDKCCVFPSDTTQWGTFYLLEYGC